MESHTIKMNYHDQMDIGKDAFFGEDLFNFFCTLLLEVLSDNELTTFDIKDLVMQINDEMQLIPIEKYKAMKQYLTQDEYIDLPKSTRELYLIQFQEYIFYQPGSESWQDISETKASYTNNPTRKAYKIKELSNVDKLEYIKKMFRDGMINPNLTHGIQYCLNILNDTLLTP